MDEIPPPFLDIISEMVADSADIENDPVFAPSFAVLRRMLVILRNSGDFSVEQLKDIQRELITTSSKIEGMAPMMEMLAAVAGIDINDS